MKFFMEKLIHEKFNLMELIVKRIVIDLDNTLTIEEPDICYKDKKPNWPVIHKLIEYKSAGFEIVISTARNMRKYSNSIGHINANTLPVIIDWLKLHGVPYDEIHVGKPWCGDNGFYVDDKAIRPAEFTDLPYSEIITILNKK